MRRDRQFKSLWAAVLLAASGAANTAHADTAGQLAPIADFFRKPLIGQPVLSPNGKLVAAITTQGEGHGRLAVIDLTDPTKSKILVSDADADITRPRWVNDHRLLYSIGPGLEDSLGSYAPGLWAVDIDKPGIRRLINPHSNFLSLHTTGLDRSLNWNWFLYRTLRDGSDDVIVGHGSFDNLGEFDHTDVQRLDTRTGLTRSVLENAPAHADGFWFDDAGHVVAASTYFKDEATVLVPEGSGWRLINRSNAYTGLGSKYPLREAGSGKLWIAGPDPEHESDTTVLQQLDLQHSEQPAKVLLSLPGYDFSGSLVIDHKTNRLIGVRYEIDAESTAWLDPGMRTVQAEIDAKLPGLVNRIYCQSCLSDDMFLVVSTSDHQPAVYFRYERGNKSLTLFFQTRPWIDASAQGRREVTSFTARDGMKIPVLVTFPPGAASKRRPAVVLPHGGPWVRNAHWDWEPMAQFLTSRGYVVIEPEFRGSTGYGYKLFNAGFKQWGLAMQDDVSDAMDWAVKQGWIDARRTCIGGASYGGYAVLMGLAKEPERYRCGFEWVGVSDINLMYNIIWSDFSEAYKTYGMPTLVGDQVKDAAQLKATSPLEQAAYINKPILMAYGGLDPRVPYKHGKAMQAALEEAGNRNVEWVFYPDEGHGWYKLEDNVDWWGRVERFLAKNTAAQ